MSLQKKSFENFLIKGEIVHNEHFFLSQQCFLPFRELFSSLKLFSAKSSLEDLKNLSHRKELHH